ncbi:MAG TPA: hypothetical protein VLM85_09075 [Polyangiaceae bacterium]|nr:hypothetical protein [Polyangiaceae bacterium]
MADQRAAIADRLFVHFMAPLVLGGELRPGRPIGGRNALALSEHGDVVDQELLSHVNLGRIRLARRLVPVDRLEGPSPAEWALAAAAHDTVQASHPELAGLFRASAPVRLLKVVKLTLEHIPEPASVGEALSRHTWLSRLLEITRTDTNVSFWVGKRSFLGQDPPARLLAWPELRRVHVDKTPHPLVDLPASGGHASPSEFADVVGSLLRKTPLTDLATCTRQAPEFRWSPELLALLSTRGGRTLALRALQSSIALDVETALGRASRTLLDARAQAPLAIVATLLGERSLAEAVDRAERATPQSETNSEDAHVARAVGAYGAVRLLASMEGALAPELAAAARSQLEPWTRTPAALTAATLLG